MLRFFWPHMHDLVCQSRAGGMGMLAFDLLRDGEIAAQEMQRKRAVICLSGITPAYAARHGADLAMNEALACAAIRAAAGTSVKRVFLASSAAVYGAGGGPFTESDPPDPVSDYARAKADMEKAALELGERIGVPVTVLRIGNVAGGDAILGGWRPGMKIDMLPDGTTPRRSYIGPQTFTRVLHQLSLLQDLPPTLNISSPGTVEMGGLLDAAGLAWAPKTAPASVIPTVAFDTSALEEMVPFAPEESEPSRMVAEWATLKGKS